MIFFLQINKITNIFLIVIFLIQFSFGDVVYNSNVNNPETNNLSPKTSLNLTINEAILEGRVLYIAKKEVAGNPEPLVICQVAKGDNQNLFLTELENNDFPYQLKELDFLPMPFFLIKEDSYTVHMNAQGLWIGEGFLKEIFKKEDLKKWLENFIRENAENTTAVSEINEELPNPDFVENDGIELLSKKYRSFKDVLKHAGVTEDELGRLGKDGKVRINDSIRNISEAVRSILIHEYKGHVNIAYLKKHNPELWDQVVNALFDSLEPEMKKKLLAAFINLVFNPLELYPDYPVSPEHHSIEDMELLLASTEVFGLKDNEGNIIGINHTALADEILSIWQELRLSKFFVHPIMFSELEPSDILSDETSNLPEQARRELAMKIFNEVKTGKLPAENALNLVFENQHSSFSISDLKQNADFLFQIISDVFKEHKKATGENLLREAGFYDSWNTVVRKDVNGAEPMSSCWLMDTKEDYERAKRERERKIKDKKEREEKDKKEKERVKKIVEKLNKTSKELSKKIMSNTSMSEIYNASFEHDVLVTVNRRLFNVAKSGKLSDLKFDGIDDLVSALIDGVDKEGNIVPGGDDGMFEEDDRPVLTEWFNEMGVAGLLEDVKDSETYNLKDSGDDKKKRSIEEHIHDGLAAHTHQHDGLDDFLQEITPDFLDAGTLKSIIIFSFVFLGSYIAKNFFGIDFEDSAFISMAIAPIAGMGGGSRNQTAPFPAGSDEKLETPQDWIKKYTVSLTEKTDEITLESSYLHTKMDELNDILKQGQRNNVVLVGESECTKGLIKNIAYAINQAKKEGANEILPASFKNKEIVKLNIAAILGHLNTPMGYETTIRDLGKQIMKAAKEDNRYIFCFDFDEIAWIHSKRREQIADISLLFKTLLEESTVPVIGISSNSYYTSFFEQKKENSSLSKYFTKVELEKLEFEDVQQLLFRYLERVPDIYKNEMPQGVSVELDLKKTLEQTLFHMKDNFDENNIPVVLLKMLDEIITAKIYRKKNNRIIKRHLQEKMLKLKEEIKKSKAANDTKLTNFLYKALNRYAAKWDEINKAIEDTANKIIITFEDFAARIAVRKNISMDQLIKSKDDKLLGLKTALKERVVGQDDLVDNIYRKFEERQNEVSDPNKPFGAFILAGPTGVGKTEITRALADYYYDGNMIRLDMSDYMEKNAVNKLRGAPPGFVGFEQGGLLTEAVRKNPYSVILLDEIDKAHPEVLGVLNEILGNGECTDGRGRKVSFRNTIIIMTGNVGMREEKNKKTVNFLAELRQIRSTYNDALSEEIKNQIKGLLEKNQEYINNSGAYLNQIDYYKELDLNLPDIIDGMIYNIKKEYDEEIERALNKVFGARQDIIGRAGALGGLFTCNALTRQDLEKILDIRLKELNSWLKKHNITLDFSPKVRNLLIQKGYNPEMGARPLARAIKRYITSSLADPIMGGSIPKGAKVLVNYDGKEISFSVQEIQNIEELKEEALHEEDIKRLDAMDFSDMEALTSEGISKLDTEKLKIEIPFDEKEIEKELQTISEQNGKPAREILAELKKQNEKVMEWVNDAFDNLSIKAKEGELPQAFCNTDALNNTINVLNQKQANNVFLVGGDNKLRNSMIDYLALAAMQGSIEGYKNVRVLRLDLNSIVEFIPGFATMEECMRRLIRDIEIDDEAKGIKTFIHMDYDELQQAVSKYRPKITGRDEFQEEVFNLNFFMIPFRESSIRLIMSTKNRRIGELDAVKKSFGTVSLDSMNKDETIEAFWISIKERLEKQNNGDGPRKVEVTFPLLNRALERFSKYLPGEPYMETLLHFINYVFPKKGESESSKKRSYKAKIKRLQERLMFLSRMGEINELAIVKDKIASDIVKELIQEQKKEESKSDWEITDSDVTEYLTSQWKIPSESIDSDEWERVKNLESFMKSRIKNQDEQIERMVKAVKGGLAGIKDPKRPIATLLLNGPTGNGKNASAEAMAKGLGLPVVYRNLSTIKEISDLNTLIGPPPGYVGYGEDTELYITSEVIKNPKCMVILDEFDKALLETLFLEGKSITDIFLPVFEDASLSDSIGQKADFSQCIIVVCANGGIEWVYNPETGRLTPDSSIYNDIKKLVAINDPMQLEAEYSIIKAKMEKMVDDFFNKLMRPEMRNRIDEEILLNPLHRDALRAIIKQRIQMFNEELKSKNNTLISFANDKMIDAFADNLISAEFNPKNGARSLEDPLLKLYNGPLKKYVLGQAQDKPVIVNYENHRLSFAINQEALQEETITFSNEEQIIISKIMQGLLKKRQGEKILEEEVEEWCDLKKRDVASSKGIKSPFTNNASSVISRTNDFFTRGNNDTLSSQNIFPVVEKISLYLKNSENSEFIKTWISGSIELAKRMNLQQAMADKHIPITDDLAITKSKTLAKTYGPYIENADENYKIEFLQEISGEEISIGIRFNSGISSSVHLLLFEKEWKSIDEITLYCQENKLDSLIPFCSAFMEAKQKGLQPSFEYGDKSTLWLTLPIDREKLGVETNEAKAVRFAKKLIDIAKEFVGTQIDTDETQIEEKDSPRTDTDKEKIEIPENATASQIGKALNDERDAAIKDVTDFIQNGAVAGGWKTQAENIIRFKVSKFDATRYQISYELNNSGKWQSANEVYSKPFDIISKFYSIISSLSGLEEYSQIIEAKRKEVETRYNQIKEISERLNSYYKEIMKRLKENGLVSKSWGAGEELNLPDANGLRIILVPDEDISIHVDCRLGFQLQSEYERHSTLVREVTAGSYRNENIGKIVIENVFWNKGNKKLTIVLDDETLPLFAKIGRKLEEKNSDFSYRVIGLKQASEEGLIRTQITDGTPIEKQTQLDEELIAQCARLIAVDIGRDGDNNSSVRYGYGTNFVGNYSRVLLKNGIVDKVDIFRNDSENIIFSSWDKLNKKYPMEKISFSSKMKAEEIEKILKAKILRDEKLRQMSKDFMAIEYDEDEVDGVVKAKISLAELKKIYDVLNETKLSQDELILIEDEANVEWLKEGDLIVWQDEEGETSISILAGFKGNQMWFGSLELVKGSGKIRPQFTVKSVEEFTNDLMDKNVFLYPLGISEKINAATERWEQEKTDLPLTEPDIAGTPKGLILKTDLEKNTSNQISLKSPKYSVSIDNDGTFKFGREIKNTDELNKSKFRELHFVMQGNNEIITGVKEDDKILQLNLMSWEDFDYDSSTDSWTFYVNDENILKRLGLEFGVVYGIENDGSIRFKFQDPKVIKEKNEEKSDGTQINADETQIDGKKEPKVLSPEDAAKRELFKKYYGYVSSIVDGVKQIFEENKNYTEIIFDYTSIPEDDGGDDSWVPEIRYIDNKGKEGRYALSYFSMPDLECLKIYEKMHDERIFWGTQKLTFKRNEEDSWRNEIAQNMSQEALASFMPDSSSEKKDKSGQAGTDKTQVNIQQVKSIGENGETEKSKAVLDNSETNGFTEEELLEEAIQFFEERQWVISGMEDFYGPFSIKIKNTGSGEYEFIYKFSNDGNVREENKYVEGVDAIKLFKNGMRNINDLLGPTKPLIQFAFQENLIEQYLDKRVMCRKKIKGLQRAGWQLEETNNDVETWKPGSNEFVNLKYDRINNSLKLKIMFPRPLVYAALSPLRLYPFISKRQIQRASTTVKEIDCSDFVDILEYRTGKGR